jgi:cysteine desulfurase
MPIYLDYSADTPVDEDVLECYCQAVRKFHANPNSAHSEGRAAKRLTDESVAKVAEVLGVKPQEIIFTSGASESNNLAVKGIAFANRRRGKHIISTFLEHSSVSGALTFLQEQGFEIDIVNVLPDGRIDLDHFRKLLREDTVLAAVCAVDSELGTVQPIEEIAEILHSFPNSVCRLHVDATQAVGKIHLPFGCADSVSFAPHKFFGLPSSGVLYKREGTVLEPLIHGGASTTIYRSGTPDAAMAAACAKALEIAVSRLDERYKYVSGLNAFLREKLVRLGSGSGKNPLVRINSPENAVPYILNLSVKGIKGEEMRRRLDERGVCVSVKSACSVANTPSRAVYAITHDRKNALSSWRISLSHLTTYEELEEFLKILESVID